MNSKNDHNNTKLNVAVVYGGKSCEHEISILSALSVIKQLDSERFTIFPFLIDKKGDWHQHNYTHLIDAHESPADIAGSETHAKPISMSEAMEQCDVVIPVLHGPYYEDGAIQGWFELIDKPYVGADVMASAMSMDKVIAKQLVQQAGIAVAPFTSLDFIEWQNSPNDSLDKITQQLSFPLFVKPACTGSSVGIHKVKQADDLSAALHDAFLYDHKVIIEEEIKGREIEFAVLEGLPLGEEALVSVPGEIAVKAQHEYYTYEAKYGDPEGVNLIVPADLPENLRKAGQDVARQVFSIMNCNGMARVDTFIDVANETVYFNELNTLPGFTEISLYPRMMGESGLPYQQLLTKLVELALARHQYQARIQRDWQR